MNSTITLSEGAESKPYDSDTFNRWFKGLGLRLIPNQGYKNNPDDPVDWDEWSKGLASIMLHKSY